MIDRVCLLAIAFALAVGIPAFAQTARPPEFVLERPSLNFSILIRPAAAPLITPPQVVFLERGESTDATYVVESSPAWLDISSRSGAIPARLTMSVRADAISAAVVDQRAEVVITSATGKTRHILHAALRVVRGEGHAPIGAFDAPADSFRVGATTVLLQGWALDDVAVADVIICTHAVGGSAVGASGVCAGSDHAEIGRAALLYDARPDVEAIHATLPLSHRAAWLGAITEETAAALDPGVMAVSAIAIDLEGHATVVGTRTIRVDPPLSRPLVPPVMLLAAAAFACVHAGVWILGGARFRGHRMRPDPAAPVTVAEAVSLTVVIVIFIAVNLRAMGASLTHDELFTAARFVVDAPFSQAATGVGMFNNHAGYSVLAWLAVRAAGASEWVLRMPALVLGVSTMLMAWWFARMRTTRATAVLSVLLLATVPLFVEYSHLARGYSGLTLTTLLSSHAFFLTLSTGSHRAAWVHALSCIAGAYLHLYGLWPIALQYVCFMAFTFARPPHAAERGRDVSPWGLRLLWRSFAAVALILLLLYAPLANGLATSITARGSTAVRWVFPLEVYHALIPNAPAVAGVIVALLYGVGLARQRSRERWYFMLLLLVPLFVLWLVLRPYDLYPRYFTYWAPLQAYLLASGAMTLWRWARDGRSTVRRASAAIATVAAAVTLVWLATAWTRINTAPPGPGYREWLQGIDASRRFVSAGDGVMFEHYVGKPLPFVNAMHELEIVMHEGPDFQLAFHDVHWVSTEQKEMAHLLRRRCAADDRGLVLVFECGRPQRNRDQPP